MSSPAELNGVQALFNFMSCSIVSTATMWAGDTPALVPLQATIGHFVLLLVLVQATQPTSGGHFNPMVSAVMAYWGELRATRLPWYIVAQMLGGIVGSVVHYQLLPPSMRDLSHAAVQVRPLRLSTCQARGRLLWAVCATRARLCFSLLCTDAVQLSAIARMRQMPHMCLV
jgi:glycerol uptake facilitator-like aquaporin